MDCDSQEEVEPEELPSTHLLIEEVTVDIPVEDVEPIDLRRKLPCQISYGADHDQIYFRIWQQYSSHGSKEDTCSSSIASSSSESQGSRESDSDSDSDLQVDSDSSDNIASSDDSSGVEKPIKFPDLVEDNTIQWTTVGEKKIDANLPRTRGSSTRKRSANRGAKRTTLWVFVRDLLLKANDNRIRRLGPMLKWLDREQGLFRIVDTVKLARLWGIIRNNPSMTYEKLSRALRYYYQNKILVSVPGQRLVYQFGPKATGWKTKTQ